MRPDEDFAMSWEVDAASPRSISRAIAEAVKGADRLYPRDRPGPRGRGDLVARPGGAARAASALKGIDVKRVVFNESPSTAVLDAFTQSARARHRAGRRLSRAPRARLSRRLHAVAGAVAQAAGQPLGGPRAVGRAAPDLRARSARSRSSRRANTGRSRSSSDRGRRAVHRPARPISTARSSTASTSTASEGARRGRCDPRSGRLLGRLDRAQADPAQPARRPSPPRPCSRKPRASSASARAARCASRSASMKASIIGGDTVGLITYMRTDGVDARRRGDRRRAPPDRRRITASDYLPDEPAHLSQPRPRTRRKRTRRSARPICSAARRGRAPSRRRSAPALRADLEAHRREPDGIRACSTRSRVDIAEPDGTRRSARHRLDRRCSTASSRSTRRTTTTPSEDEENRRLPPIAERDALDRGEVKPEPAFHPAAAALQRGEPGQEARGARHRPALDLRLDHPGAAGPRLCAARQEALHARGPRPAGDRVPRPASSSAMSNTISPPISKTSSTTSPAGGSTGRRCCANFWRDFSAAIGGTKDLKISEVHRSARRGAGPAFLPRRRAAASDARLCPVCGKGGLALKLGRFGAFIGCSNYPECRYTRRARHRRRRATARAPVPGHRARHRSRDRVAGDAEERALTAIYVQLGEGDNGDKPKRASLPKGMAPAERRLSTRRSSSWRCRARSAATPRTASRSSPAIGRFGPYLKHGNDFRSLGADDDVLTIGLNRAVSLLAEPRTGRRRGVADAIRALGAHPGGRHGRALSAAAMDPMSAMAGRSRSLPRAAILKVHA